MWSWGSENNVATVKKKYDLKDIRVRENNGGLLRERSLKVTREYNT